MSFLWADGGHGGGAVDFVSLSLPSASTVQHLPKIYSIAWPGVHKRINAVNMKGLTQFCMDIRNSRDAQEEHKRICTEINTLKGKFTSSTNGSTRKRNVCKLLYIYLLGYNEVKEIGLRESMKLILSSVYSEKKLGYLTLGILLDHENNQTTKEYLDGLLDTTYPYLVKDLQANNDEFNCLAIEFIASSLNVSIDENFVVNPIINDSNENAADWLEITDLVYSFCCSPIHSPVIKKKASLALLCLIKIYPNVILSNNNWILRLLNLIESEDFGVVLSAVPLVDILIHLSPQYVKSVVPMIATLLHDLVVRDKCPIDQYYYDTPAPWLCIELLLLIEKCFLLTEIDRDGQQSPVILVTDIDTNSLGKLRLVVARYIHNASQKIKGQQNRNAQSAILFQVVSLIVFLDASKEAIEGAIHALVLLLDSKETNTRYLSLDALIKLIARSSVGLQPSSISARFEQHLSKIFILLLDKDISVRRKALDLLYTVCNSENYIPIVQKLIEYFPSSDFILKNEIAVKIAVMAENFATDSAWYIQTMLKLLSLGGGNPNGTSYIGDEVWVRIVQIVVNNENLHSPACELIVNLLLSDTDGASGKAGVPENLLKVAAFILGEYGHLIANESDISSLSNQFQLLLSAYFSSSLVTRAMLLSTFFKFTIRFPDEDFVPDVIDLFEAETQSIDVEIQTRACEYLRLATVESNKNLALAVVKPLPAFDRKENPLLTRLGNVNAISNPKRSNSAVNALQIAQEGSHKNNLLGLNEQNRSSNHLGVNSISSSSLASTSRKNSMYQPRRTSNIDNPFEDGNSEQVPLSPNWQSGYQRMRHYDAGIFFENQFIKIVYRTIRDGPRTEYHFTIINNAAKTAGTPITKLRVLDIHSKASKENPSYLASTTKLPDATVIDKTEFVVETKVREILSDSDSPVISMTLTCGGSFNHLALKIPVSLLKTVTGTLTTLEDFKIRWIQIGQQLGQAEGEESIHISPPHRLVSSNIARLMTRIGFTVVYNTPDNEGNILVMSAGIIHTSKSNYGVLITTKSVDAIGKEFLIVIRCTGGGLATLLAQSLREILEDRAT